MGPAHAARPLPLPERPGRGHPRRAVRRHRRPRRSGAHSPPVTAHERPERPRSPTTPTARSSGCGARRRGAKSGGEHDGGTLRWVIVPSGGRCRRGMLRPRGAFAASRRPVPALRAAAGRAGLADVQAMIDQGRPTKPCAARPAVPATPSRCTSWAARGPRRRSPRRCPRRRPRRRRCRAARRLRRARVQAGGAAGHRASTRRLGGRAPDYAPPHLALAELLAPHRCGCDREARARQRAPPRPQDAAAAATAAPTPGASTRASTASSAATRSPCRPIRHPRTR